MSGDSRDDYFCGQLFEHRCRSITHTGTWREPVYECYLKHKEYMKTPILYAGLYKELEWELHLYPKGDEYVPKRQYVSIHPIMIRNNFLTPVVASYKISFLDYDKNIVHTQSFTMYMKEKELKTLPAYSRFLSLAERCSSTKKDFTCVHYCVTITYVKRFNSGYAIRQMFGGFSHLLQDQKYCDVTLVSANGDEMPAHKVMLSARSPVFSAMFEHYLEEQKSNIVKVDDIESDILQDFLQCLYSCRSKFLQEKPCNWMAVCKLLCAADKYQVLYLKELCAKCLEEILCVENARKIFKLADLQNITGLKRIALDFINENSIDINENSIDINDNSIDINENGSTDTSETSQDSLIDELDVRTTLKKSKVEEKL